MKRGIFLAIIGTMLAFGLGACGSGSGGGIGGAVNDLIGQWVKVADIEDGEINQVSGGNQFSFIFFQDGTWQDSGGDNGRWTTNGALLTVSTYGDDGVNFESTEQFAYRFQNNANQLVLTFLDSLGNSTNDGSIYNRTAF